MGIDAEGWFDIEGEKITAEAVSGLTERFLAAGFDVPEHEWFLLEEGYVRINFDGQRYYGPHYERGPFPFHLTVLGWLLRNLPKGGRVFYGGDVVCLEYLSQWTPDREREYLDHYLRFGHEPYRNR